MSRGGVRLHDTPREMNELGRSTREARENAQAVARPSTGALVRGAGALSIEACRALVSRSARLLPNLALLQAG